MCLVWVMLVRSPTTTDSAAGSVLLSSSPRCWLRACNTTLWPCSNKSCAAIRPKPSDEPVMKIRAIDISFCEKNDRAVERSSRSTWYSFSSVTWQLRYIPSTADGFDEEDARIHATPLNVDVIALICQQYRLRRDDLEIVVYAPFVPVSKELK